MDRTKHFDQPEQEITMGAFDDMKNKATQAAQDHPEQAEKYSDQALDKTGNAADGATGDKYSSQVDAAQKKGDDAIGS